MVARIMHPIQSVFIKGRLIHDGVLALHEIIHEVKTRRQKVVFLKIDFLREALQRKGFDDRWITRIMQLVSSGRTAININGETGLYFKPSRGVRHGDPYLHFFNLAFDGLAAIMDVARHAGHL